MKQGSFGLMQKSDQQYSVECHDCHELFDVDDEWLLSRVADDILGEVYICQTCLLLRNAEWVKAQGTGGK